MPSVITRSFRIHNAKQFKEAFTEPSPTRLFSFIARITPWDNESVPPTPVDRIQDIDYCIWRGMTAAKKITDSDVTYAIPRYNWSANTIYREWNSTDSALFDEPVSANTFYVYTSANNVYKCLFNNKAAASINEPTSTSTSTISTADGYLWKFMYNVSSAEFLRFATDDYIPVTTLTSNNGSDQWLTQQAAANGAINVIEVTAGGNGYLTHTGAFVAVSNSTIMTLAANASIIDDSYNDYSLFVSTGLGSSQLAPVVNYVGATKVVTLGSGIVVTPNTSSTYLIAPTITLLGDGTGATAYANVDSSSAINYINIISAGSNYSKATALISGNTIYGSGATSTVYMPPSGGHGSDPITELAGHNIVINMEYTGDVSNTFPIVNDFRTIGIVKDPLLANNSIATGTAYDQTTKINITSVTNSGAWTQDEIVEGTYGTARVVTFANTNSGNTAGTLSVVSTNATFTVAETITGNTSSTTAVVGSVTDPQLTQYSGEIMYVENTTAITRSIYQTEDFKLVIKF